MTSTHRFRACAGPGIQPYKEDCLVTSGCHVVSLTGDNALFNGVRNWRCEKCFKEHINRVRFINKLNVDLK